MPGDQLAKSASAVNFLRDHARDRAFRPAIIADDRVINYRQLQLEVGIIAHALREQGVKPGAVVGISMGRNALHVMTLLAVAQIGAVSLPVHPAIPLDRRLLVARRFGASCIVSGRDGMQLEGFPFISVGALALKGRATVADEDIHPVEANSPLRIAISSGTSGDPKGMVLTHETTSLRAACPDPGFDDASRTLPMDINFIIGFRPAISALAMGTTLVLPSAFDAGSLLRAVISHAVTHIYLSPAQAKGIVESLDLDDVHCPNVVCLRIGGGALAPGLLDEVRRKLTPNVYVSYGSTESGLVTYATPEILARHPTCVGRVCSWAEAEVLDADGRPLPPGVAGSLRIRSRHQVAGYHLNEALTRSCFRDGWFYPGDLAHLDNDGLLYIDGRIDEQLNIGGAKINPEDIDRAIATHPDVAECGAFLLMRGESREALAVALVLRNAGRVADIEQHAHSKLGPLAPAHYFPVPSLPRTITGKLRRTELMAQFSTTDDAEP